MKHVTRILDDLDSPEALRNTVIGTAIDLYALALAAHQSATARFGRRAETAPEGGTLSEAEAEEWRRWWDVSDYALHFARRTVALALQAARPNDREEVSDCDGLGDIHEVSVRHGGRVVSMIPTVDEDHCSDYDVVILDALSVVDLDSGAEGGVW
jgi:hypothetical protein